MIEKLIQDLEQPHLLQDLASLTPEQKEQFAQQLKKCTRELLEKQRAALAQKKSSPFAPLLPSSLSNCENNAQVGLTAISQGKVGCLILAGGQASRLKKATLKGATPVSLIKKKSLFQLFFERAKALRPLPMAVMTSPLNHAETLAFFEEKKEFGYPKELIDFFPQEMLPLLDSSGNWFLAAPGKIAEGPDGNGNALRRFYHSGTFEKWRKAGVEHLCVIQVDNALADPFDAALIGAHINQAADITIKAIPRENPGESVGILGLCNGKLKVCEYSEIDSKARFATDAQGKLAFNLAHVSFYCFSFAFIEKTALHAPLPWHIARKLANDKEIFKCETFLFDLLDVAEKSALITAERWRCFAPLKNASGDASLTTVQAALQNADRRILSAITGQAAPSHPFELDPAFYYPTPALLKKWQGAPLPNQDYIQP